MKLSIIFFFLLLLNVPIESKATNGGLFSEINFGSTARCYSIRRAEVTGFQKFASGEKFVSPDDVPGAIYAPSYLYSPSEVYSELGSNLVADYLCVGDTINISSPIYTNGGNIIIVANNLIVNAPIDTRIYFNISDRKRDWRMKQTPGGEPWIRQQQNYYSKNDEMIQKDGNFWAPELPGGSTIRLSDGVGDGTAKAQDGSSAPLLDDADIRRLSSGTIKIFAHNLNVANDLADGRQQSSNICADALEKSKPFAFQAGGIRGGKGGMGSPPGCYRNNGSGGFSCREDIKFNSGYSGKPSAGGDAGNILIVNIDGKFSQPEIVRLSKASNSLGGPSGNTNIYQTFNVYEANVEPNYSTPDICQRTIVGQHPVQPSGRPGVVTITNGTTFQALSELESFANQHDAQISADISDLVQRARTNSDLSYTSFIDFLRSTLARIVLAAERDTAYKLADFIETGDTPLSSVNISPFQNISLKTNKKEFTKLSNRLSGLAQRLSSLDISSNDKYFYSYFAKKGGVLNITNPEIVNTILTKGLSEDLSEAQLSSQEQLTSLRGIETTLTEALFITKKNELISKINFVSVKINELQTIINNRPGEFDQLQIAINKAAPAISSMVGAITSENWFSAASEVGPLISGLGAAGQELFDPKLDLSQNIETLRKDLLILKDSLNELTLSFASEKSIQLQRLEYSGVKELIARQRIANRLDARIPYGEDLIKLSLATYLSDTSKNKEILKENLREIGYFLEGRSETASMLRIKHVINPCDFLKEPDASARRCILVPTNPGFIVYNSGFLGTNLPIYMVAPGEIQYVLPTLGLPLIASPYVSP